MSVPAVPRNWRDRLPLQFAAFLVARGDYGRMEAEVLARDPWKAETGLQVGKSRQLCGESRAGAVGGARRPTLLDAGHARD